MTTTPQTTVNDDDYIITATTPFTLPEWTWETAENEITKANRRLERAGITERFTATWSEPQHIEDKRLNGHYRVRTLTINKPSIAHGNYTFIALVEDTPAGMLVRTRAGEELNGYAPQDTRCSICGHTRTRTKTYLVRHNHTGELTQVGSTCVERFTGIKPSSTTLWALQFNFPWETPANDTSWINSFDSTREQFLDTPTTTVIRIALAQSNGGRAFVTSRAVREGYEPISTGGIVQSYLPREHRAATSNGSKQDQWLYDLWTAIQDVPAADVTSVLEYAKELPLDTDYTRNINLIANHGYVRHKDIPLFTSIITSWVRAIDRETLRKTALKDTPTPGYLATPGDKLTNLKVRVVKVTEQENYYGPRPTTSQFVVLRTLDTNHALTWTTTIAHTFTVAEELTLKIATVKEHRDYTNPTTGTTDNQTVITRGKIA